MADNRVSIMASTHRIVLLFILALGSLKLSAQDADFVFYSDLARDWYEAGDYFEWTSTTADNNGARVNIFYRTWGDESKPKLLLIHGFPNSSFDYYRMIPLLEDDFHIAALDFPVSASDCSAASRRLTATRRKLRPVVPS